MEETMQEASASASAVPHAPTTLTTRPAAARFRARSVAIWLPFAGGVLAVTLAAVAEAMVSASNKTMATLALYLAAVAVFAVSAWPLRPTRADKPIVDPAAERPQVAERSRALVVLGVGTALSVIACAAALLLIRGDLGSIPGIYLWLLSLVLLGATGIATGGAYGWAPRWGSGVWPTSRRALWLMAGVVAALLAIASAARLIELDTIPLGINADEGDRAAVAIRVVRGQNTSSIFDSGWYYISMVYYWLMAQLMKVIGIGYTQARVFGAIFSIASVGIVTWIGMRNFGVRVGLLAGGILALLGISLQFARETTEATPTATLWALSALLFLEAARTGKLWAWTGAGMAGGFAIYFYPSGRLWSVVAALFGIYLLVHGLGGRRAGVFRGLVLAAVASLMVMGPFLVHSLSDKHVLTSRAEQTSIFVNNNTSRLNYVRPEWGMPELLAAQLERSVGVFHEYADQGGFWPTGVPLMSGLLAMLTLLGMGWVSTRWRDPRYVLIAIWFWVGLSGMVVTVETPNVQRMATAVPALAIFSALVLDNLARRVEALACMGREKVRRNLARAASGAAAVTVAFIMFTQYQFYFVQYGKIDHWFHFTMEGQSVNDQGSDTLVISMGRFEHMVNSGWVRLLAPFTPRAGLRSPGSDLPLTQPADTNLAFLIDRRQKAYIPYVQSVYPGGTLREYVHQPENIITSIIYRLSKEQWEATQGAMVTAGGKRSRVDTLGTPPDGWSRYPASMQWQAGLRVHRYWNYTFRIGPGPAKLSLDGQEVIELPAGQETGEVTVSLPRGDHFVQFEGTVMKSDEPAEFVWAAQGAPERQHEPLRRPRTAELISNMTGPQGLLNITQIDSEKRPVIRRIDNTIATCCFSSIQVRSDGKPYRSAWTGTLQAESSGTYSMTLMAIPNTELRIDGKSVIRIDAPRNQPAGGTVELSKGPHMVELEVQSPGSVDTGVFEWTWTPPDGETSIVPPSALRPPQGSMVGPEIPTTVLGPWDLQPFDDALSIVP